MGASSLLASLKRSVSLRPVRVSECDPALQAFHAHLAERLQHLRNVGSSPYLHLNWLLDAMAVLVSTHSSLLPILQAQRMHKAFHGPLLDDHMDDTVKLLDVCNLMKAATGDIHAFLRSVAHGLHCLQHTHSKAQLLRARNCLSECLAAAGTEQRRSRQLQSCRSLLRTMANHKRPTSVDPAHAAMDGARFTTVLVCGVIATALSPVGTTKKCSAATLDYRSSHTIWSSPLLTLQQELVREQQLVLHGKDATGTVTLLHDVNGLHAAVNHLHLLLETLVRVEDPPLSHDAQTTLELRRHVDSLGKTLRDVQTSMSMLEQQITDLFQSLVAIRMALVDASVC